MNASKAIRKVGFIGLGIMGASMARNLMKGGYELHVNNRTRAKADELIAEGAAWHETPGELAEGCDAVITIIGYPADVEAVYLGSDGLVERAGAGTVLIDMTTSSPSLARRIDQIAAKKDVAVLDAPVSGGDAGARDARLSIMVGGGAEAFEAARPLFEVMGTNIVHQGPAGAGQHTKMCNQIAIASIMMAVAESLGYARAAGLDPETVLKSIATGAAGSFLLNGLGPKMLKGDYAPGFYIHHFIKDMGIALAEAEAMKLDLPGLAQAKRLYDRLAAEGYGNDGTQALFRLYDR